MNEIEILKAKLEETNKALEASEKAIETAKAEQKIGQEEALKLKKEHSDRLSANQRLASGKEAATDEANTLRETINKNNEEFKKINKYIEDAQEQTKKTERNLKKDLIKQELKKSGFTSEELLLIEFNIDELKIVEGKIDGFEEKTKSLKEKYPLLYVDGGANTGIDSSLYFKKQTSLVEDFEKINNKLLEGKKLSEKEQALSIFGNNLN